MTRTARLAYIVALLAIAIGCMTYALDLPPWGAAALVVAALTPVLAMAVYDHLWGVQARTRQLLADGQRLGEKTARL
jgi:hypothetical protein